MASTVGLNPEYLGGLKPTVIPDLIAAPEALRHPKSKLLFREVGRDQLERDPYAQLCGKRNAYGCAGPEEISQCALGYLELLQAGDGGGLGASCIGADACHAGDALCIRRHLGCRNRKLDHVDGEVCTRIIAVEKIEKLDERVDLPALLILKGRVTRRSDWM